MINDADSIPLVDLGVNAEGCIEKHLSACLVIHPKETLSLCDNVKLRINKGATNFWNRVNLYRDEILDCTDEESINKIASIMQYEDCRNFLNWYIEYQKADNSIEWIDGKFTSINPIERILNLKADLEATRGATIWLQRVQDQHLFDDHLIGV